MQNILKTFWKLILPLNRKSNELKNIMELILFLSELKRTPGYCYTARLHKLLAVLNK